MNEAELLGRITVNPHLFGGKPIIRGRPLAVEHVLGMLRGGSTRKSSQATTGLSRKTFGPVWCMPVVPWQAGAGRRRCRGARDAAASRRVRVASRRSNCVPQDTT